MVGTEGAESEDARDQEHDVVHVTSSLPKLEPDVTIHLAAGRDGCIVCLEFRRVSDEDRRNRLYNMEYANIRTEDPFGETRLDHLSVLVVLTDVGETSARRD